MNVVREFPVGRSALLVKTVGIYRSVVRPWMDAVKRVVLVNDLDAVPIDPKNVLRQGLVHARAKGTLKIVIVDDGDLGILIAADRAPGQVDLGKRIRSEVKLLQMCQGLLVF